MVQRVYVAKRDGFDVEGPALLRELVELVGIAGLTGVRVLNRYDVEGIDAGLFAACVPTVFSEPAVDETLDAVPAADAVFAVEYLPGQFDQRADSAAQCVQLLSQGERPAVRSAKVYLLEGDLSADDVEAVKRYVINPVEAREADLAERGTLAQDFETPDSVETVAGFTTWDEEALERFRVGRGLAMDHADIVFCQRHFADVERRDPTITEIKLIDTYWSDHCRHTTFGTELAGVTFEDPAVAAAWGRYEDLRAELGRETKPRTLMDVATIGAKALARRGVLTGLDESEEINACTVRATVDVDGHDEEWLYLFKNETHNHPTEIEPFGGAATCIGGAIRDPLSGRAYVYQAMRVTGAADPTVPVADTIAGKLPQRKLVTTAAEGYSSYGNQIGLATGQVDELYHPGYAAKRLEIGAVVGAAPAANVRREVPAPGDVVILLGGRTGRDGIGGATGSSKAHDAGSLETCGAEVQKGNAPEERKLQRLFRDPRATGMIKRCNDFGAGGVSVAIGELADGLDIDLDRVPKKYEGLDGTELAISESQERMAVVVAAADADAFINLAHDENLEATVVATVTAEPRMRQRWNGSTIVDLSRDFLNSNGAPKAQDVTVEQGHSWRGAWAGETFAERMRNLAADLNVCGKKGLGERFDSTIGAATVLMPYGGARQLTPTCAMVAKLPVPGETTTVSGMSWGFNPYLTEADPYRGAYSAVVESVAKLVCAGFRREDAYLTFQEYFPRLGDDPARWGRPLAALLGALDAQIGLGVGAIGGKDSMSGSFEDLDVPSTLVSFATALGRVDEVVSPEFKQAGSVIVALLPFTEGGIPVAEHEVALLSEVERLAAAGAVRSASTPGYGGLAEAILLASLGNAVGVKLGDGVVPDQLFEPAYGAVLLELDEACAADLLAGLPVGVYGVVLGRTTEAFTLESIDGSLSLSELQELWESRLEGVFPYRGAGGEVPAVTSPYTPAERKAPAVKVARPRVIIPVFPGTNCEYDTARAFERAGAEAKTLVLKNLSAADVAASCDELVREIDRSQILMLPGGFSGGDEPDGSAKFIAAFFRSPAVADAVMRLLNDRDGLALGICNGFQALIKLGLVPYGEIRPMTAASPTLTHNTVGRHQSMLVRTRVASNKSPWLSKCEPGDEHLIAVSHGEGRFVCEPALLDELVANGQVATQYVDPAGNPTMDLRYNPNGSVLAVEGVTSPDGRVLGKMGHTERSGRGLYRNVPGNAYQPLFEGGVDYFRL